MNEPVAERTRPLGLSRATNVNSPKATTRNARQQQHELRRKKEKKKLKNLFGFWPLQSSLTQVSIFWFSHRKKKIHFCDRQNVFSNRRFLFWKKNKNKKKNSWMNEKKRMRKKKRKKYFVKRYDASWIAGAPLAGEEKKPSLLIYKRRRSKKIRRKKKRE